MVVVFCGLPSVGDEPIGRNSNWGVGKDIYHHCYPYPFYALEICVEHFYPWQGLNSNKSDLQTS